MKDLGLEDDRLIEQLIEVRNKSDLLSSDDQENQSNMVKRADHPMVLMSAVTGEGVDTFLQTVEEQLARSMETLQVSLDPSDGKTLSWLYAHGEVIDRQDEEDAIHITVNLEPANLRRFEQLKR